MTRKSCISPFVNLFIINIFYLLLPVCSVFANPLDDFHYRINMFGTLGFSTSDSERLGFIWDYEQDDAAEKGHLSLKGDSNLGVQFRGSTRWFSGTLQLLARDRAEYEWQDFISLAFIDFYFGRNLTLRAGKIPWEVYLHSDSRAVGYSQLAVRPPPEFYALRFGESYSGIDIRYKQAVASGFLTMGLFAGTCEINFSSGGPNEINMIYRPMAGVNTRYEVDQLTLFASYLWANATDFSPLFRRMAMVVRGMEQQGVPGAVDFREILEMDDVSTHNLMAGFLADVGNWTFQGEGNLFLFDKVGSTKMYMGYLLAGYRIGNWIPYTILAGSDATKDDIGFSPAVIANSPREAAGLMLLLNDLYNGIYADQTSVNVGLRWDFRPGAALKWQLGHYRIEDHGAVLWRPLDERASEGRDINVFSTALDFAF